MASKNCSNPSIVDCFCYRTHGSPHTYLPTYIPTYLPTDLPIDPIGSYTQRASSRYNDPGTLKCHVGSFSSNTQVGLLKYVHSIPTLTCSNQYFYDADYVFDITCRKYHVRFSEQSNLKIALGLVNTCHMTCSSIQSGYVSGTLKFQFEIGSLTLRFNLKSTFRYTTWSTSKFYKSLSSFSIIS